MEYVELGCSGLSVSRIIFGTWAIGGWMWGGTDDAQAIAAVRAAIDAGITTIDTAPMYGFGHSERIVGEAVRGRRDEVVIATKCGLRWDRPEGQDFFPTRMEDGREVTVRRNLSRQSILEEIDLSLERLGVDYVDLYQCHWPDPTTDIEETMGALSTIVQQGKARAVGVSNFTPEMMRECLRHGAIASDQPLYNMLDRDIDEDVLPFCADNGVGVIVYSPLHQGLLTGKVGMDREFPSDDQRSWKPWFKPANRQRVIEFLDKLTSIAQAHDRTLAQVAVNWCLCQRGVSAAIVGARRPEQVTENAGGAGWSLTQDELATIRGWLEELGGPAQ